MPHADPVRRAEYAKEWRQRNRARWRELRNAASARWRVNHPDRAAKKDRGVTLRAHHMTQTDFDRMWAEQDGCCAVCGRALDDTKFTNTHVDHDHVTGVVRAILCRKCNLAMAVVDDATWLAKLVAYRDRHAAKRPPTQCECDEAPKHAEFCPARKAKAVQP